MNINNRSAELFRENRLSFDPTPPYPKSEACYESES